MRLAVVRDDVIDRCHRHKLMRIRFNVKAPLYLGLATFSLKVD